MNIDKNVFKLMDFISNWVKLSQYEKQEIYSNLSVESYIKGDIILNQGKTSGTLKFVTSGIYRVYQLREGKEITSYFNYEARNPVVASFTSLLKAQPSNEIIECIVPGQLLSIDYNKWVSFYNTSHALNTFGRLMAEHNYILAIERIESLQYKNATERYNSFIKLYPNLLNLIPMHYIASYLGITPESLSRIRKNTADNSIT